MDVFKEIIERLEKAAYNHADYGTDMAIDKYKVISIIENIAEEYNNGWILCSERLPEKNKITKDGFSEEYWCKLRTNKYYALCEYDGSFITEDESVTDIIAWRELPDYIEN